MATIRCFPGDVLKLYVNNRGNDGNFRPSATKPTWVLDNHFLAEFFEMAPDGNSIKVLAIAVGAPIATATTDAGPVTFTLDIVAPLALTQVPFGDYERHPPLRPKP